MDAPQRYSDTVLDHYRNPRNVGEIDGALAVAQAGDPTTGDVLKISLRISDGTITEARFKAFGCTAAIAAGSMASTLIVGRTIEEAERLTNLDVVRALGGLPEAKVQCSVLAEQAIRAALRRFRAVAVVVTDAEETRCRSSAGR